MCGVSGLQCAGMLADCVEATPTYVCNKTVPLKHSKQYYLQQARSINGSYTPMRAPQMERGAIQ